MKTEKTNFADLLTASEQRIDKTNAMICKLSDATANAVLVLSRITEEYARHLDDLKKCRDSLLEQNGALLRMHERDIEENRKLMQQANANADRIYGLLSTLAASRGVTIENN